MRFSLARGAREDGEQGAGSGLNGEQGAGSGERCGATALPPFRRSAVPPSRLCGVG